MRVLWCWRCKMNIPMLDEDEYAVISELYSQGIRATQEFRKKHNLPLDKIPIADRFLPLLAEYEKMTGFRETVPNAIMHHRISIYGPPCPCCGKVLRTDRAFKCFECGYIVKPSGELAEPIEPIPRFHRVRAQIRYLTAEEGGRAQPVFDGYRGQFHYAGEQDEVHDGFQRFPTFGPDEPIPPGKTVPAVIEFHEPYWTEFHSKRMAVGTRFQIQEGRRIVGRGVIAAI